MANIVVAGAGGFIGNALVSKLTNEGHHVIGVDLKYPEFSESDANDFLIGDLRNHLVCDQAIKPGTDIVYQLAAEMGGAEYIFTGENDAKVMTNSALINLNVLDTCKYHGIKKIFFSSSACVYPEYNQLDPNNPNCEEDSAYPAEPDSCYGWEKLFAEQLYNAYARNYNMDIKIARLHNIFGPLSTYRGIRAKAPAALCRKVAEASNGDKIEVIGDGKQTRSFLHIDECLTGIEKLIESDFSGPVNIGSEEMITINDLAKMIISISNKKLTIKNIEGPQGVRGRNSDNTLIEEKLKWKPTKSLFVGLYSTYTWVKSRYE